jgi:Tol biopolymer transport system component
MRAFVSVVFVHGVGRRARRGTFSRRRRLVVPLAVLVVLATAWSAAAAVSVSGVTTRVSGQADAQPGAADISADGRYVVFVAQRKGFNASVLVHDRQTGRTTVASVTADGGLPDGPSGRETWFSPYYPVGISGDGRYVGFTSWANNLVAGDAGGLLFLPRAFVRDMQLGMTTELPGGYFAAISADGRKVAYFGGSGLLVRDLVGGATTAASVAADGAHANGGVSGVSLSADGRFVAFSSNASNLVPGDTNSHWDVFVRDLVSGVTSLVSVALDGGPTNGDSGTPTISAHGRYVAFESDASNLVRGDTNESRDVFVHDRLTGKTTRMSVASNGGEGWDPYSSGVPHTSIQGMNTNDVAISGDGRFVAYVSGQNSLVRGDENDIPDVFVRDRRSGVTSLVSVASTGAGANGPSLGAIAISGHGRDVAFGSGATNLVSRPKLVNWGVYVRDRLGTRR